MDLTTSDDVKIQDDVVLTEEEAKKFEEYCQAVLLSPQSIEELEPIDSIAVVDLESLEDAPSVDFGDEPMEFEAAEHELTAKNLILYQFNGLERPGATEVLWKVPTRSGTEVELTFGRIIALAGDHFSNRDANRTPICGAFYDVDNSAKGKMDRFESAVTSLLQDQDDYLLAVNSLLKEEWDGVVLAKDQYLSVKQAYHNHQCGLPTDENFWHAESTFRTGHVFKSLSVYSWLGWLNADHFGDDAVECYKAGHQLAMEIARSAAKESTKGGKAKLLIKAYVYDAFACHFLTDLFSSGHLRSPRRDLHCKDILTMTASTALGKFMPNSKGEVPVYDHHARYMHDDDCATGLLVKNKKGDQWICYGDKQLHEPCNRINLAKVQNCVQESVSEIYNKGFLGTDAIDAKTFIALDLIPQPMVAIEGLPWKAAWGNHDIHNPAPLWNVNAGEKDGRKTFTSRSNVDDHSDFTRKDCSPEAGWIGPVPTASQGCKDIRDGHFRGDDQFTASLDAGELIRAGFIQVQDLDHNQLCVNVWAQAAIKGGDSSGENDTFTIRRRFMDIDGGSPSKATNLHWLRWYNPKTRNTCLFKLDWEAQGSESDILVSGYSLESLGNQCIEYDPTYHAEEEHQPKAKILFSKKSLLTGLPTQPGRANLSRFLVGNFTGNKSTSAVDLAAISFANDGIVRVLVQSIDGNQFGATISQKWSDKLGFKCWVKTLQTPDQRDNILIISLTKALKNKYFFKVSRIWVTAQSTLERAEYNFESYWTGSAYDVNVLVGDVLGRGKQDIIVSADGNQETHSSISTYSFSDDMKTLDAKAKHKCDGADTDIISPCFTALIPSAKRDSKQLDVLTVRYQKGNNKNYLCFHTHTSKNQAVEKDPWSGCDSTKIEDTFFTNKNFFHIKWLRCSTASSANAVMEVFSYYGVLGVRIFAPSNKSNVDWTLTGVLPYLGQTSIGAGLGCYRDWGYGFMPWGEAKDFEDINEWISWRGVGSYAMSEKDVDTVNVRGFDVSKRRF